MQIRRTETTIIPQTQAGRQFADEYEARLKGQGALKKREEDTVSISITAEYYFGLQEATDD